MEQQKKHIVVFIGPPGSGKGSLSQACVQRLGWKQLSTGDLCRKHIAEKTDIGRQIDFFTQSGKLVSDDLIIKMVEDWLFENFDDFDVLILDGFPRTRAQAQALANLLRKEAFKSVDFHVVELSVDDAVVADRLTSRMMCPSCGAIFGRVGSFKPRVPSMCDFCEGVNLVVRSDDTPESIAHRLEVYHKHADELLDFYRVLGIDVYALPVDRESLDGIFADFRRMVTI